MNKKIYSLLFGLVLGGLFFIWFRIDVNKINSEFDEIQSRFKPVLIDDSLNNYVVKKHVFSDFKYTPTVILITIDNNEKIRIYASLNPAYEYKGINDILEEGDLLRKNIGNDTISIIKKDTSKVFYFLLKKFN